MFAYFKKQREKREASNSGKIAGAEMRAEIDQFIELEIVPQRNHFLEVFNKYLRDAPERLVASCEAKLSLGESVGIDYRVMMENWNDLRFNQMTRAEEFLHEWFEVVDNLGIRNEFLGAIEQALDNQKFTLMREGLELMTATLGTDNNDI
jgi:hypothetical protein